MLVYTRTCRDAVLACGPAAESEVDLAIGLAASIECLHIDGRSESGTTACRGSHTTLNLKILGHTSEIGDIVPEHFLAFGVVERDAVDVDIDAASIHATDAD